MDMTQILVASIAALPGILTALYVHSKNGKSYGQVNGDITTLRIELTAAYGDLKAVRTKLESLENLFELERREKRDIISANSELLRENRELRKQIP